jgi:hypothetical protein
VDHIKRYGENADNVGCSETHNAWDSDEAGDGISNALDNCPNNSSKSIENKVNLTIKMVLCSSAIHPKKMGL